MLGLSGLTSETTELRLDFTLRGFFPLLNKLWETVLGAADVFKYNTTRKKLAERLE